MSKPPGLTFDVLEAMHLDALQFRCILYIRWHGLALAALALYRVDSTEVNTPVNYVL